MFVGRKEPSILSKCQFFPTWSIDSMQSQSKSQLMSLQISTNWWCGEAKDPEEPTQYWRVKTVGILQGLDRKEGWAPKNWCFWTVVLDKTLESPLDSKEIKPVDPKGNQSWVFVGRTDAEAETPILWPPDVKSQLIGKDTDAGKDWGQEKGATEDAMVGWHHWLNGCAFE